MYKVRDKNRATSMSYELVWKCITLKKNILDHMQTVARPQIDKKFKQ